MARRDMASGRGRHAMASQSFRGECVARGFCSRGVSVQGRHAWNRHIVGMARSDAIRARSHYINNDRSAQLSSEKRLSACLGSPESAVAPVLDRLSSSPVRPAVIRTTGWRGRSSGRRADYRAVVVGWPSISDTSSDWHAGEPAAATDGA